MPVEEQPINIKISKEQLEKERNPNYKYFSIDEPKSTQTEISEHRFTEKEIRFALSPDYLSTNIDLVMEYELHQLIWIFKLPKYDNGKNEVVVDDEEGQISIRSEEGVVEWLIRGTVDILNVSDLSYKLDLETLYHTVIKN